MELPTADAMAITLARSSVDLSDDRDTALLLLEAGYDEREIAHHRLEAASLARKLRHVEAICSGALYPSHSGTSS